MRHAKALRKFSRTTAHRRAMFRNLATALLEHGSIETTVPKAKDLRRIAEKLISLASRDTVARRRRAYGYLKSKTVVHRLFAEIGPRYRSRPGGYARIVRTHRRAGDAAEMGQIQLVIDEQESAPASGSVKKVKQGKGLKTVEGEVA